MSSLRTQPMPTAPDAGGAFRSSLAHAAFLTLGTNVVVAGLSLVNVLAMARDLGPEGRGQVVFLITVAGLTALLTALGVSEANANLGARRSARTGVLATNSVLLAIIIGGLSTIALLVLIAFVPGFSDVVTPDLLALAAFAVPFVSLQQYLTFLVRARYRFAVANLSWLLMASIGTSGTVLFALTGQLTVALAFWSWIAGVLGGVLLLVVYVKRRLGGFKRPDPALARETISFGVRSHVGSVLSTGAFRLDQWFVGLVVGSHELGLYSVAVAVSDLLLFLPTILTWVQRTDLVLASRRGAADQTAAIFRLTLISTIVPAAVMVAGAGLAIPTVFGSSFAGAVDDLQYLALGAFGAVAMRLLGNALLAQGHPTLQSLGTGAAFVTTVVLDILLVPGHGGTGAAIASLVSYTAGGVAMAFIFVRALHAPWSSLMPRWSDVQSLARAARSFMSRPVSRARPPRTAGLVLGGVIGAVTVGAIGGRSPIIGAALAVAIVASLVIGARPAWIVYAMTFAISIEVVAAGGYALSLLLAPFGLLVALAEVARRRRGFRRSGSPGILIAAYASFAMLSAGWAAHRGAAGFALLTLSVALVYFFAIRQLVVSTAGVRTLLGILACGAVVMSVAAFAQAATGTDRSFGTQGDPNYFAAYQVVAVPLVLVLATHASRTWARSLAFVAVIAAIASVFTSASRGGLLSLGIVALFIALAPTKAFFSSGRQKTVVVVSICIGALLAINLASQTLVPRVASVLSENSSDASGESAGAGRVNEWRAAFDSIQAHPLGGLGTGGFKPAANQLLLQTPGVDFHNFRLLDEGIEAHNAYLSVASELGLPGLVLFLGIIGATFVSLRRSARLASARGERFLSSVAIALMASLAGWCAASMFLSAEMGRPLWMILGLSAVVAGLAAPPRPATAAAPGAGPSTPTRTRWPSLPPFPATHLQTRGVQRSTGADARDEVPVSGIRRPEGTRTGRRDAVRAWIA